MHPFFQKIEKIEQGHIDPVYLLVGGDYFLIDQVIKTLQQEFKPESVENYYGDQDRDQEFSEALFSVGMFSQKRILVYHDINNLLRQYQPDIERYFKQPDPNSLLILIAPNERFKFVKSLKKAATSIKVYTPFPNQYTAFVEEQISRMGYEITSEALTLLIATTDDSLTHTFSELEKAILHLQDQKTIDRDTIKHIVGGAKQYQMYDFIEAMGNKNFYRTIDICLKLIDAGSSPPYFISALYHYFLNVWSFPYVHAEKNYKKFSDRKKKERYAQGHTNYKNANYEFIFNKLLSADLQAKSLSLTADELMIPLIYKLMHN